MLRRVGAVAAAIVVAGFMIAASALTMLGAVN